MLLLARLLSRPTLHEHSEAPSAGLSCIFSGFLTFHFLDILFRLGETK